MAQNRCRRSGRRACVTVNGRAWNVGQPAYSQSDRSAVDAIAALGGGGGTVSAPRCSTSTPPVATMRVEPVGRGGCRSRSSRYWSEQVLERADRVERNGEGWRAAVRYTRERGAQPHDPPGNRLIVFKRPRSVAASNLAAAPSSRLVHGECAC